jgi:Domain of unknown function (DUF4129)
MRSSAARTVVPALVVLALVGVVAVAATGSTATGSDDARPPSATVLDTILTLGAILVLPGAAILVYGLMQRKEIARELATKRYRRTGPLAFVVLITVFTTVTYYRMRDWEGTPIEDQTQDVVSNGERAPTPLPADGSQVTYEPEFAWIPVLVVLALVAVGVGAALVVRRSRGVRDDEAVAEEIADALDDSLDDLRAESDFRRAVIAAYARLERVLAARGVPRRAAETPEEYLGRTLRRLAVDPRAVRRLTELFTRAKFSGHEVDGVMKEQAISALTDVRDELRSPRETSVSDSEPVLPLRPGAGRI